MNKFILALWMGLFLGGCSLPDLDKPNPPQPSPVVKVGALWVITVDDLAQRANDHTTNDLVNDSNYWASLQARGHHVAHNVVSEGKYQPQLAKVSPPIVILLDASTKHEITTVKLPKDTAGIDALVAKYSSK